MLAERRRAARTQEEDAERPALVEDGEDRERAERAGLGVVGTGLAPGFGLPSEALSAAISLASFSASDGASGKGVLPPAAGIRPLLLLRRTTLPAAASTLGASSSKLIRSSDGGGGAGTTRAGAATAAGAGATGLGGAGFAIGAGRACGLAGAAVGMPPAGLAGGAMVGSAGRMGTPRDGVWVGWAMASGDAAAVCTMLMTWVLPVAAALDWPLRSTVWVALQPGQWMLCPA